jgi:hypothetical protein
VGEIFPNIPPHVIAVADQELAHTDTALAALIDRWNELTPLHEQLGSDRLKRITSFLASELVPQHMLVWALLAAAIERLASVQSEV